MFIINGFVGLDSRDLEGLHATAGPIFCHTMYEVRYFRGMLELAIQNCADRQDALGSRQLAGEQTNKEGELWHEVSECLIAKALLESTLMDLDDLSGNLFTVQLEEYAQPDTPMTASPAAAPRWIN